METWSSFTTNAVVPRVQGKLLCSCFEQHKADAKLNLLFIGPNSWIFRVELQAKQKTMFDAWCATLSFPGAFLLADVAVFGVRVTYKKEESGLLSGEAIETADVKLKASLQSLPDPRPFRILSEMNNDDYMPTSQNYVPYLIVKVGVWSEEALIDPSRSPDSKYSSKRQQQEKFKMRFSTPGLPTVVVYASRLTSKAQILALENQVCILTAMRLSHLNGSWVNSTHSTVCIPSSAIPPLWLAEAQRRWLEADRLQVAGAEDISGLDWDDVPIPTRNFKMPAVEPQHCLQCPNTVQDGTPYCTPCWDTYNAVQQPLAKFQNPPVTTQPEMTNGEFLAAPFPKPATAKAQELLQESCMQCGNPDLLTKDGDGTPYCAACWEAYNALQQPRSASPPPPQVAKTATKGRDPPKTATPKAATPKTAMSQHLASVSPPTQQSKTTGVKAAKDVIPSTQEKRLREPELIHNSLPVGFTPLPPKWKPTEHRGDQVWVHGQGYGTVHSGTMAWPRIKLEDLVTRHGDAGGIQKTCRDVLASMVFLSPF